MPVGAAGSASASVVLLTSAGVASSTAVSFAVAAQLATVAGGFVFVPVLIIQALVRKASGVKGGAAAGKTEAGMQEVEMVEKSDIGQTGADYC